MKEQKIKDIDANVELLTKRKKDTVLSAKTCLIGTGIILVAIGIDWILTDLGYGSKTIFTPIGIIYLIGAIVFLCMSTLIFTMFSNHLDLLIYLKQQEKK